MNQHPQPDDVAALRGEHAELAGEGGEHQDRGVERGEREVEQLRLGLPELGLDRADREVHREQGREEHQLGGQPDDGADGGAVRPVDRDVAVPGYSTAVAVATAGIIAVRAPVWHPRPPECRERVRRRSSRRRADDALGWACRPTGPARTSARPAALPHRVGAGVAPGRRRAGRRGPLPVRRAPAAGPRRPLAGGRTVAVRRARPGLVRAGHPSALAAYDTVLFWVHMVQHMVLAMLAPVFLALGAPITLALRTLPRGGPR